VLLHPYRLKFGSDPVRILLFFTTRLQSNWYYEVWCTNIVSFWSAIHLIWRNEYFCHVVPQKNCAIAESCLVPGYETGTGSVQLGYGSDDPGSVIRLKI
jgi:hypothetical protein